MAVVWGEVALLPGGWAQGVAVRVDGGRITDVTVDAAPEGERVGVLLPAPANLHSHGFQRRDGGADRAAGARRRGTASGPGGSSCSASWTG
jgi:cytosine/adenosine deaminase-related metal-dependent hydrolase